MKLSIIKKEKTNNCIIQILNCITIRIITNLALSHYNI
jgi:hypothetical protein